MSSESNYQHPATAVYPPFQPGAHGINDYAIMFQAEWGNGFTSGKTIHVSIRQNGTKYYDWRVEGCCAGSFHAAILFYDTSPRKNFDSIVGDANLPSLEKGWRSYRVEVKGDSLRFLIDGAVVIRGLDRHELKGGMVSIMNQFIALKIRNFEIVAQ